MDHWINGKTGAKKLMSRRTSPSPGSSMWTSLVIGMLLQEMEILAGHNGFFKDWQRMFMKNVSFCTGPPQNDWKI